MLSVLVTKRPKSYIRYNVGMAVHFLKEKERIHRNRICLQKKAQIISLERILMIGTLKSEGGGNEGICPKLSTLEYLKEFLFMGSKEYIWLHAGQNYKCMFLKAGKFGYLL